MNFFVFLRSQKVMWPSGQALVCKTRYSSSILLVTSTQSLLCFNAIGFFITMKPIVLIGFSGSGKSTLGKRLAACLGLPFYDLDSELEKRYSISIMTFFQKYGENAFRICERCLFFELLGRGESVISTGGGTPCFFDTMDIIEERAFSIYIKLSPKSLCNRLLNSKRKRPLLLGKSETELMAYIDQTLFSREKFYSRANLVLKGEDLSAKDLEAVLLKEFDSAHQVRQGQSQ